MVKVVKFGGSSLASAEQFKKVKDIITADGARRFVVPSAPGKRFPDDTKVTDMLYSCYDLAVKGKDFDKQFEQIKQRYNEIISELGLDFSLEKARQEEIMRLPVVSTLTVWCLQIISDITSLTQERSSSSTMQVSSMQREQAKFSPRDLQTLKTQ